MTLARIVLVFLWIGVTAYALFGGADFGGGFWDLLAGGPRRGKPPRERIEHSIGPVWEANHVWLIFALVVLWSGFPGVFAAMGSTLYIPFSIAAFGIICRGSAFVFRKQVAEIHLQRLFGGAFAVSSVLTPFAFGTIAGAVASGRVPPGIAQGDVLTSWINPTSILGGVLAVAVSAYLAAVYLTADSRRDGESDLVEYFRHRAVATGIVIGVISVAGFFILRSDAPRLYNGLVSTARPLIGLSAIFGMVSLALLLRRNFIVVRGTAAMAVVSAIWSWGVAQYPDLLEPGLTVDAAAAAPATLVALIVGLTIGAILVVPPLLLLFGLFQQPRPEPD